MMNTKNIACGDIFWRREGDSVTRRFPNGKRARPRLAVFALFFRFALK